MIKVYILIMTKSLCVLPWIHLHIEAKKLFPCCRSNTYFNGIATTNDPITSFNQQPFIELREKMLAGEKPVTCKECWHYEEVGISSLRERSNHFYKDELNEIISNKKTTSASTDIKYITSLNSNTCNLACRTCEPYFSTKWNEDALKLNFIKEPINYHHEINFEQFNNCNRYYFVGGEPLLKSFHKKELLEIIQNSVPATVELNYSTNLSYPRSTIESYLPLWEQFKTIKLYVSIDHFESDKYSYLRHPGNWQTIEDNLKYLKSLSTNITIGVQPTISIFNITKLAEMLDYFLIDQGIKPENILLNPLLSPTYYKTSVLPEIVKEKLTKDLMLYSKKLLKKFQFSEGIIQLVSNLQGHIKKMNLSSDQKLTSVFFQTTKNLDKIRDQNFKEVFPDLNQLLED